MARSPEALTHTASQNEGGVAELRRQLREAQDTLEVIRRGGVDSLVIGPPGAEQVYALTSADRPYRLLVDAMNEGAATISAEETILYVNPRLAAMVGRPATGLVGTGLVAHLTPASYAELRPLLGVGAGQSARGEVEFAVAGGPTLPVLVSVSCFDLDGTVLRCLVVTDLTPERQVAEARRAVRASEARFRALFDHAPIGIALQTLDGRFEAVNRKLCEFTGYSSVELLQRRIQDITHPEDAGIDQDRLADLIAGRLQSYAVEKRHVRKDGTVAWAEVSRSLVSGDSGHAYLVSAVRDLSVQKRAEEQLRALAAQLEERVRLRTEELERANESLESFTYSVSHDLRGPLRSLSGFSQLLLDEYGDGLDDVGKDYLRRVQGASVRMAALIDDLLALSRVARAQLARESVDLSAMAKSVAVELQRQDPHRRAAFSIQGGMNGWADRTLIRTVLENLLGNAWKFTAKRPEAAIQVGTEEVRPGTTAFFVRDNGAGFDQAYASRLFLPFSRLHSARDFPGTGVGLVSARNIVERHGGHIWAEGAVDAGATFWFTLGAPEEPLPATP